ncbi:MAG: hypothetical protein AAB840_01250 [Patescibacteria group bacterium]
MEKTNYKHGLTLRYLASNLYIVAGLVLVWRGVWYVLDGLDLLAFGGSHWYTGLGGIILGVAILYFPDHDLKEIQKL